MNNGKITSEIHLPGMSKERIEELGGLTYGVALGALGIMDKIQCAAKVEIIKILLYYVSWDFGGFGKERPSMADFQVVFYPFFRGDQSQKKLQLLARWQIGKENISGYVLEQSATDKERHICWINLTDTSSNTLSLALIGVMQAGIRDWAANISQSLRWLESIAEILDPSTISSKS